jgi:hypothetical protein
MSEKFDEQSSAAETGNVAGSHDAQVTPEDVQKYMTSEGGDMEKGGLSDALSQAETPQDIMNVILEGGDHDEEIAGMGIDADKLSELLFRAGNTVSETGTEARQQLADEYPTLYPHFDRVFKKSTTELNDAEEAETPEDVAQEAKQTTEETDNQESLSVEGRTGPELHSMMLDESLPQAQQEAAQRAWWELKLDDAETGQDLKRFIAHRPDSNYADVPEDLQLEAEKRLLEKATEGQLFSDELLNLAFGNEKYGYQHTTEDTKDQALEILFERLKEMEYNQEATLHKIVEGDGKWEARSEKAKEMAQELLKDIEAK